MHPSYGNKEDHVEFRNDNGLQAATSKIIKCPYERLISDYIFFLHNLLSATFITDFIHSRFSLLEHRFQHTPVLHPPRHLSPERVSLSQIVAPRVQAHEHLIVELQQFPEYALANLTDQTLL